MRARTDPEVLENMNSSLLHRRELTWFPFGGQIRAAMYRIVLSVLIALAVGLAPVGSALSAYASSKAAMHDCHGKKTSKEHSCCDKLAKCPDSCGVKCCKLMGMIVCSPIIRASAYFAPEVADPQKPPDWQLRPRPPPPRS